MAKDNQPRGAEVSGEWLAMYGDVGSDYISEQISIHGGTWEQRFDSESEMIREFIVYVMNNLGCQHCGEDFHGEMDIDQTISCGMCSKTVLWY